MPFSRNSGRRSSEIASAFAESPFRRFSSVFVVFEDYPLIGCEMENLNVKSSNQVACRSQRCCLILCALADRPCLGSPTNWSEISHPIELHWLVITEDERLSTEAGAEPTPLGGCEKFVIKFPLHVHNLMLPELKKSLRHLENV